MKRGTDQNILHELLYSSKNRLALFKSIPLNNQGFTLLQLARKIQRDIMHHLSDQELSRILNYLDPDKITDLLQLLEKKRQETILKKINESIRDKVTTLLKFDPNTAAGLMNLQYLEIPLHFLVQEVADLLRKHEKRTGKIPTLLVVERGYLQGELPMHSLALANPKERIDKYVHKIPVIHHTQNYDKIIEVFREHQHRKIVVLDKDKSIMGIIYPEDVLSLIDARTGHSLKKAAGVHEEEEVYDSFAKKVKYRWTWLVINLATAFLAASVVSLFSDTISKYVLLAAYMPIIAGMGGNAATQTMAVFVRGIALKEIELNKYALEAISNEVIAGVINGFITGGIAALIAVFWNQSPMLGVVVGCGILINLMVAGFFGGLIPLIMKRLGKDPASSATIFITTATDVLGFFAFLGLATYLLM
ncbi:magnesium transporter [Candidatus Woesearchaeota archaeon]|nr:magnesium transporter [Candidatus Woesearchaeota archaeon]